MGFEEKAWHGHLEIGLETDNMFVRQHEWSTGVHGHKFKEKAASMWMFLCRHAHLQRQTSDWQRSGLTQGCGLLS